MALEYTPIPLTLQQPVGAVARNCMDKSSRSLSLRFGMRRHSCRLLASVGGMSRLRKGMTVCSAVVALESSPSLAAVWVCTLDMTLLEV